MRLMAAYSDLKAAQSRGPNFQAASIATPPNVPPLSECHRLDAGDNAPPSIRSRVHLYVSEKTAAQYASTRKTRPDGSFDEVTLSRRSEAVHASPTTAYEGWCVFPEDPKGTPPLSAAPILLDASVPPILGAIVSGWVPTMNWRVDFKAHPAAGSGPLRFRFQTRSVTGGWLEEDGELWDGNGNIVALSRQLARAGVSQARM